jgi:hypothetical protein
MAEVIRVSLKTEMLIGRCPMARSRAWVMQAEGYTGRKFA